MTKQKLHVNPPTHKQRRTTKEQPEGPPWKGQSKHYGEVVGRVGVVGLNHFCSSGTSLLILMQLDYKHMFGKYRVPLSHL